MAPSNKPVTLRDLRNTPREEPSAGMPLAADNTDMFTGSTPRKDAGLHEIFHIPTLPNADEARQMLERVVKEFLPIAKRRGYVVLSVSELCCCNDGLDFTGRRKLRAMSNNVWGYNRTVSRGGHKVHTIHLRLRHAQDHHRFLAYEDVAGTLAHELSHCEHGPHNEHFYKLMDDILEEHATLMASSSSFTTGGIIGSSSNPPGFVPFEGEGRKLGGGSQRDKNAKPTMGRGRVLGGDACFTQWMTPREAAVVAALARQRQQQMRLRGNRCCRPCVVEEGAEDDDDEVQVIDVVPAVAGRKRPPGQSTSDTSGELGNNNSKRPTVKDVIDLTSDESKPPAASAPWACTRCTFLNFPTTRLSCEICSMPRAT